MTKFFSEFREFILKGNALDLAVGLIIGAAFGSVVSSLVTDVLMPPLGYLMGGVDFSDKVITLAPELHKGDKHPFLPTTMPHDVKAVVISYGKFINSVIALIIQGLAVFLIVKGINTLRRKPAPADEALPAPPEDIRLLTEIRDALTSRPN